MKKVLTIAGSDSGGGAGIQADLKAFAARGVYGMSAITALTAQNTVGVQGIFEVSPDFVAQQIDSVMSDIGADAWKTGMLSNTKIIEVVKEKVNEYNIERLICDPVMVAKSGDPLLKQEAQDILINKLLPLTFIITPNKHEAEVISKMKISDIEEAKKVAIKIHEMGAKNVIIKGGHFLDPIQAIDVLYDGKEISTVSGPRIDTTNTHGTGCTYASSIAAEIAKGYQFKDAVKIAKEYLTKTIEAAVNLNLGNGHGPLNHFLNQKIKIN
ncbi:MAG: bifunctional hydroxymethylpyrimidine kinase/phosphomethylpyrimidine kinase [Candidatus Lokiarchaeota archaeon]|nr:bifunctional hydroxymethylpyrimidine kinase/phosphomethylpyrimidine kinase [Candidatus Lokiarchaeota archaeon]MBD3200135.1 bifunctional hydroxymethylpyrimidine kinase/phosphomethylpyrimidine kinase [Candidatus Lokiarchaeota archaeon]